MHCDLLRLSLCSMDLFCAITAQNVPPSFFFFSYKTNSLSLAVFFSSLRFATIMRNKHLSGILLLQVNIMCFFDSTHKLFLSFLPSCCDLSLSLSLSICLSISVLLCLAPGVDLTYFGVNSVRRVGHTPAQEDKVSGGGR